MSNQFGWEQNEQNKYFSWFLCLPFKSWNVLSFERDTYKFWSCPVILLEKGNSISGTSNYFQSVKLKKVKDLNLYKFN